MVEPGQQAPDFELPDQDGRSVKLSDFRGQPVVVYFYPKAATPGCTAQACGVQALVGTLEAFLEADGNVAGTAQRMFTHRHTIYYRLERVRELSGHDVSSSDGREKLSLGLKAMRVLGIASAAGPASEAGAGGGRVPRRSSRGG